MFATVIREIVENGVLILAIGQQVEILDTFPPLGELPTMYSVRPKHKGQWADKDREESWDRKSVGVQEFALALGAKVGDAATIGFVTDSYPATVIEVSPSGKTIKVQQDTDTVVSGYQNDGSAQYVYSRNTDAPVQTFTWRKNLKCYVEKGAKSCPSLHVGNRRRYYDPHF